MPDDRSVRKCVCGNEYQDRQFGQCMRMFRLQEMGEIINVWECMTCERIQKERRYICGVSTTNCHRGTGGISKEDTKRCNSTV